MDENVTIEPPLTLRGFCESVSQKHAQKWPPSESTLAEEFVSYFQFDDFPTLGYLQQLCIRLGVTVSFRELPKGIRGFNHAYEDQREILIGNVRPEAEDLGSRTHTLLHELREQIEFEFRKVGHPVVNGADNEERAEGFAIATRLYASGKAAFPVMGEFVSDATSRLAKFGWIVLFVVVSLAFSLSCIALPKWEDQLF